MGCPPPCTPPSDGNLGYQQDIKCHGMKKISSMVVLQLLVWSSQDLSPLCYFNECLKAAEIEGHV